ncbi:protein kinase domain-containing protein [Enhygromyxa salina]|uniref:protein kinase domain-containing protein n=1 Tax=Enhygromyxa salina TaxID=215803 RepID=UPI0015E7AD70|nr:protein kinase [Enhygromyxa salina]
MTVGLAALACLACIDDRGAASDASTQPSDADTDGDGDGDGDPGDGDGVGDDAGEPTEALGTIAVASPPFPTLEHISAVWEIRRRRCRARHDQLGALIVKLQRGSVGDIVWHNSVIPGITGPPAPTLRMGRGRGGVLAHGGAAGNLRPVPRERHADDLSPAVGQLFAGRYQIEALLGRGGMGSVFRADDRAVGETVALKTLDTCTDDQNAIERFRGEVRLARRVTHRNAARTYDLGEHHGLRFLTMEYVQGQSLRAWLVRRPRPLETIEIALQLAAGLAAAHDAGVIHRDLKPRNIMIETSGRAVITDFGIARMHEGPGRDQTGALLGTPAYMAPEQVEAKPVDARTDEYALALIVVEMLTGALPFSGSDPAAVALARLDGPVPDLAVTGLIPAPLLEPLTRALSRDPEARWPSVTAFARALEQAREQIADETLDGDPEDWDPRRPADSHPTVGSASASAPADDSHVQAVDTSSPTMLGELLSSLMSTTTDRTGLRLPTPSPTSAPEQAARALAVLPFRYRGPADSEFVADALLDELIDLLSMTRGLKVSGSGATARLAGAGDRDPRSLGAELGVDVVVDGSIQLAGKRLRIAARLLDVDTGFQLWSERFDGLLEDVFELQDKLGKRIAEALRVELQIIEHRGGADADAIERYLRARQAKSKWELGGPDGAVTHYRAVLDRAPEFKPAIAGLAIACMRAWFMPKDEDDADASVDWASVAKIAVERAMAEAPQFAETRIAAASWSVQGGYYREAAEHLREALRIAPTCALAHEYLGRLQTEAAHPERGIAHLELALELDPALDWCLADLARHRALRGDYDGYDRLMVQLLARTVRHHASAHLMQMRVGAWRRDTTMIREALRELESCNPSEGTRSIMTYGPPLLEPYDPVALDQQHELMLTVIHNGRMRTLMHQLFAEQAAFHHDHERTLSSLEAAAQLVLVDLDWLDNCPLFVDVRQDPRFAALRAVVRGRCEQIWAVG